MKPNIILILLDGARWDRLQKSSEFVELIKLGTLFNNITTTAPYTFASMNSIFTGLYGKENGVDSYYRMFRLKDSVEFLPEILQKNGYYTSCDLISDKVISSRGFDIYQSHNEYENNLKKRHPNLLKNSFEKAKGKPIFTFFQFSKIHTVTVSEVLKKYEWNDKEFYNKKDDNLKIYDTAFKDAGIYAKIIYDTILELGKIDNTLLIFFTDHGTGVGERFGERNYGVFLYEETLRTFYLFIGMGLPQNQRFNYLLKSLDIFPTILEICGIPSIGKLPGTSLTSFIQSDKEQSLHENFCFSETGGLQGPYPSPNKPNVFCVKTSKYKLIYFQTPNEWKMFDLIEDPKELVNVYGTGLKDEKALQRKLLDWINR